MHTNVLRALLLAAWIPIALPGADSSIIGTVTDPSGSPIADARILVAQSETGLVREVRTDATGHYQIPSLPIGEYTLRCEKEGFQTLEVQKFSLSINQNLDQSIAMRLANISEKVDVREQPEALETAATTASTALGIERVEDSPSQNRNYLNFVLIAPGVAPANGSNALRASAGMRNPVSDSGFSFGGLRGRNNGISIDGVDNRDEATGGNRVAVPLELVQEFRVSGSTIAPEFGGAAGGLVNVVTRSGTNVWHGDNTMYLQNEFFNARSPEAESATNPRFRRYQPGASFEGPIQKDRTFFSAAFEEELESSQEFSEVGNGAVDAINRTLALPIFARSAVRQINQGLYPADSSSTEFAVKASHQINTANVASMRYAFSRSRVNGDVQGIDNFSERSSRGNSLTQDNSLAGELISVPSPTFVNDLRVQFSRRSVEFTPNARGALIEIPGVVSFGQSYQLDGQRMEDHYQVVEGATWAHSRHQIGFGVNAHLIRFDSSLANRFGGIYIFPTLGDFLQGRPDVFLQAFGDPRTSYSTVPIGVWFQDHWQPFTGVTIEGGVRYDAQKLPRQIPSATNNWSPRLGVAWHPRNHSSYVVRAGFGLFYDRYPLAFLNDAIQKDGVNGFEQYTTGLAAQEAFLIGEGGTLTAPLNSVAHSVYRASPNFPSTYSRKFTAGVERSFGSDTTLSVEYSDIRGYHLPRIRNIDLGLPPLYWLEQTSSSTYRGVTVSLNRRVNKELTYLFTYTGGRAWDDASDFDEQALNPANTRLDWARSRQYQAHRVSASGVFELPLEDVHTLPGWLRDSFEMVDIGPILTAGSPTPVNALATTDLYATGAYPISARPSGLARNPFYERGTFSLDLRVTKTIPVLHERARFLISLDFYNLTNHTNALRVSPYFTSTYRGLVESLNARQVQFGGQFEF
jgi:hypothetical protein